MANFATTCPTEQDMCNDSAPLYGEIKENFEPIFSLPDIKREIQAAGRYSGDLEPGAADEAAKAWGGEYQPFYSSRTPRPPRDGRGC